MRSYAVVWRTVSGVARPGRLELDTDALRLRDGEDVVVPYDEISAVRTARSDADRIDGRRTLVLELVSGVCIFLTAVAGLGPVLELADVLANLAPGGPD